MARRTRPDAAQTIAAAPEKSTGEPPKIPAVDTPAEEAPAEGGSGPVAEEHAPAEEESPPAKKPRKRARKAKPKKSRKGRKLGKPRGPTLTKAIREALIENIRAGVNVTRACQACRVPRSSWYHWKKLGDEGRAPYKAFLVEIAQARAEFETENLKIVGNAAANGDWRASLALLERHPHTRKRWSLKQRVEHTGKDGGPIQSTTVPLEAIEQARAAAQANVAAVEARRDVNRIAELEAELEALRARVAASGETGEHS